MGENNSVLPIVVLFYPEEKIINRLLHSLAGQVRSICIVDNTPITVKEMILSLCDELPFSVHYIELNENKGIAFAQNRGIEYAFAHDFEHVLLLDQDSALPSNMVSNLLSAESSLLNEKILVAAVGPAFQDEKTGEIAAAIVQERLAVNRVEIIRCDHVIASGSLIRVSLLKQVGVMLEELFIDWVDIEWGERCRHYGYGSYIIPSVVMHHSIGDEYVSFLGRKINLHSDFRNYFIVRNAVYLLRKKTIRWNLKFSFITKIPKYIIFYSFFSKRKVYSFFLLFRAVFDGVVGNMGEGNRFK